MGKKELEDDPKQKLINRIRKEELNYRESYEMSVNKNYQYESGLSFDKKNKAYNGGFSIYGPKFTDYTELEQAYCLAHELGHHHVNERMSSFKLKVARYKLPFVVERIELLAWKEAKIILLEENIKIDRGFNIIKEWSLNTYKIKLKQWIKSVVDFAVHIFIIYYKILFTIYLLYSCGKNSVIDLFGMAKYFKNIDVRIIGQISKIIWILYIVYSISKLLIRVKVNIEQEQRYKKVMKWK